MTMITGPTDAQLVALAEKLGFMERHTTMAEQLFGGRVFYRRHTPNSRFSLRTWPGCGAVIEAMLALGWDYSMEGPDPHMATFGRFGPLSEHTHSSADGATLIDAAILAACAAMEVQG